MVDFIVQVLPILNTISIVVGYGVIYYYIKREKNNEDFTNNIYRTTVIRNK